MYKKNYKSISSRDCSYTLYKSIGKFPQMAEYR